MGKKVKSSECSGRWCSRHLFSIKPFFIPNEQTKQDTLRLCPKMNKATKRMDCLLPQLNLDSKFYTPLFTLQQDRMLYIDYDVKNRESFLESQREEEYEISEIMVPKQSSSKKYCKVCKQDFTDYLQHIQSQTHLQKSTSNRFSGYIAELHHRFQHSPQNKADLKETEQLKPIMEDFMKSQDCTLPVQARNKTFPLMRETIISMPYLNEPSVEEVKVL